MDCTCRALRRVVAADRLDMARRAASITSRRNYPHVRSFASTSKGLWPTAATAAEVASATLADANSPKHTSLESPATPKLSISSCPPGTKLAGLNYLKNGSDPVARDDTAYPSWLWTLAENSASTLKSGVPAPTKKVKKGGAAKISSIAPTSKSSEPTKGDPMPDQDEKDPSLKAAKIAQGLLEEKRELLRLNRLAIKAKNDLKRK